MKRLTTVAWCWALVACAAAPAAHAKGSLTPAGEPEFPNRAWVLTLPAGISPSADAIAVTENGKAVQDLQVSFANEGTSRFAVVLVIDASESMHGRAIVDAMAAARALAGQRPAQQPLGIVTFNGLTKVVLPPTTDADAINQALSTTPELQPGTHIFDATTAAAKLLDSQQIQAGAIVVLSDGSDSGSATPLPQMVAATRSAHAKIFTVGLRSRSFEPSTLREVANKGAGDYLGAATGKSLSGIYRRLGGQLANAYILRYQSYEAPASAVKVVASVGHHEVSAAYTVPGLKIPGSSGPLNKAEPHQAFLRSTPGLLIITFAFLLLAFVGLAALLLHRQRGEAVRLRIGEYGLPTPELPEPYTGAIEREHDSSFEKSLLGAERYATLHELLEIARIDITPGRLVGFTALGSFVVGWLAFQISGFFLFGVIAFAIVPFAVRSYVMTKVDRQRRAFADQLADSVQATASAMRTGHSFASALSVLVEDAAEPSATEFRRVIADERLGIPLEEAFGETVRRMDNRDLEQVALVAVLQRETGGNGAEALDRVVENLRARDEVRRLIRTLTAQGRISRLVLSGLPVALLAIFTLIGHGYVDPLYNTTLGRIMLAVATGLVWSGSVAIKKIVEIDV